MRLKAQVWFLLRVGAVVAVVVGAKTLAHNLGWEIISLNALFTGIIAANVFLMGFLLSGVLSDYKESERLPAELSSCLENMAQEVVGIGLEKPGNDVSACLVRISAVGQSIIAWFYRRVETDQMLAGVNDLTVEFARLGAITQATFIARLKQEQSNLRRTLNRIETIRETCFVAAGYLLAYTITVLLCIGLILIKMDTPLPESLFFVGIISFLLVFLLTLIRDLDNPFGYYERFSGTDVSLEPFQRTLDRLAALPGSGGGRPPSEPKRTSSKGQARR